jgi:putative transposase
MLEDQALYERIKAIQEHHEGRYGSRRMTAALRDDGGERKPGHNQVARIMKDWNLQAVIRRKNNYKVCMKKGELPDGTVLENTLNRKFEQKEPRKVFVTDVTYVPIDKGWLYVSAVLDLCTREVVVCEMSTRQDLALAMRTLDSLHALAKGPILLHSDQGALYTSSPFRKRAAEYGIKQSYSRRGNCWDNAVMEGWNGTLKAEWMYLPGKMRHRHLVSAEKAEQEIRAYCVYYNEKRIQEKLNYRSPKQFREAVEAKIASAVG